MSAHKKIDKICVCIVALTVIIAMIFCCGKAFGIETNARTLGYENRLFDRSKVHTFDIVMDDWDSFIETCESETYSNCTVIIDGEKIKNVGIRGKGNTSLSSVRNSGSSRYSFKVEFDQYDSTKTYHGLDKLCLNNIIQDNTYMKDYLAYTLMADFGVDAPLCSFVYITVNGEDWGLYLAVEAIEDSFLERNYGSNPGDLYKPDSLSFGGGGPGNGKNFSMTDFINQNTENMDDDDDEEDSGNSVNADIKSGSSNSLPFSTPEGVGNIDFSNIQENFGNFDPSNIPGDFGNFDPSNIPEGFGNFNPSNIPEGFGNFDPSNIPEGFGNFNPSSISEGFGNFDMNNIPDFGNRNSSGIPSGSGETSISGETSNSGSRTSLRGNNGGFGGMGGFGGFGGMGSDDVKLKYIDDDPDSYSNIFNNAKTTVNKADKNRLIIALKALTEQSDIENTVDVDEVLRYFVVHLFLCNGDSYTGSMIHNYYLHEKDGKLSMIPWDYNLAFGSFQGGNGSSSVNAAIDTPISGDMSDRPMVAWIFDSHEYTELYHKYFSEFLSNVNFTQLIDDTAALIDSYVEKDPTKFCTYDDFKKGVETIRQFCELRKESVQGQLDGTIPSTTSGQNADSSSLIDASSLNISDMGSMGGGNGGGFGGGFGKRSDSSSERSKFNPGTSETKSDEEISKTEATPGQAKVEADEEQKPASTSNETNASQSSGRNITKGSRPTRPDSSQSFGGGNMPEGSDPSQGFGGGNMPEGFDPSQGFGGGNMPEGFDPSQGFGGGNMPEGFNPSQGFGGGNISEDSGSSNISNENIAGDTSEKNESGSGITTENSSDNSKPDSTKNSDKSGFSSDKNPRPDSNGKTSQEGSTQRNGFSSGNFPGFSGNSANDNTNEYILLGASALILLIGVIIAFVFKRRH